MVRDMCFDSLHPPWFLWDKSVSPIAWPVGMFWGQSSLSLRRNHIVRTGWSTKQELECASKWLFWVESQEPHSALEIIEDYHQFMGMCLFYTWVCPCFFFIFSILRCGQVTNQTCDHFGTILMSVKNITGYKELSPGLPSLSTMQVHSYLPGTVLSSASHFGRRYRRGTMMKNQRRETVQIHLPRSCDWSIYVNIILLSYMGLSENRVYSQL